MEKVSNIVFHHGHPLGTKGYGMGAVMAGIGLVFLFAPTEGASIFGIIALAVALLIFSFSSGVIIDLDNKLYKKYDSVFILKKGTWKDLSPFTDICVLHKDYSRTVVSRGNYSFKSPFRQREVYLMDKSHLYRIFLEIIPPERNLQKRLEEISRLLDRPIVQFNPQTGKLRVK